MRLIAKESGICRKAYARSPSSVKSGVHIEAAPPQMPSKLHQERHVYRNRSTPMCSKLRRSGMDGLAALGSRGMVGARNDGMPLPNGACLINGGLGL